MKQPLAALAAVTICFVCWLGFTWLALPPSNQELLANYAKVQDYTNGAQNVGGWPWWTPSFLQGASLAPVFSTILTNASIFLFSQFAGLWSGPKLAGLALLAIAPFTMYALVARLTGRPWAAVAAAIFYLTSPSLLLRLGYVEHISVVSSMALLPLMFWGVLRFLEVPSVVNAVLCGTCAALLTLAYAKIAVLALPILAAFALWAWFVRARLRLPPLPSIGLCLGVYVLLAVLFNLPAMRETGFVTKFAFAPFESWQRAFSTHSVISWIDFFGIFSGESTPASVHGRDGAFVGLPVALLFVALLLFRKAVLHRDALGSICRLFLALALFAQWLSFGPHPALLAQVAYLKGAVQAPHPSIAISWFLLAVQVWMIFYLLPQSLPWRRWLAGFLSVVYLAVPGFALLSRLPLYGDIRAPYDTFHTVGIFCVCAAAGCAFRAWLESLPAKPSRWLFSGLAVALTAAGTWVSTRDFRASPLDDAVFSDFSAAQKYLAESPVSGRVLPLSGRYFYLLTPLLSQRGLALEAFNSFYMLKEVDTLQKIALTSSAARRPFLDAGGISHILIDAKDPDTPPELKDAFRALLPVAFENDHFVVLENKASLAPAFWTRDIASAADVEPSTGTTALNLFSRNIAVIESPVKATGISVTQGAISGTVEDGQPFTTLLAQTPRHANFHEIRLAAPPSGGWVIVPEAFHPDWTAEADGRPLEVRRALTAFLAAYLPDKAGDLVFTFRPPAWYGLCATLGACSWLATLGFLGFATLLGGPAWRKRLFAPPPVWTSPAIRDEPRPPVRRPVVVLPTYNEASSIHRILDITFGVLPNLEILVVDDGSPDGTAALVRGRREFGRRLHLLERSGKLGLGSAYKTGFQWAIEKNYDACLEMDADLSHNPTDIPRLLEALDQGADAAIGSRYLNGIRVMNWPEDRLLLSAFASKYVRTLTRLPLTDATSGFKAIRASALRVIDWSRFRAEGYGFQVELHHYLWLAGFRLVEVPIVFTERSEGKTKMTRGIAIEAALRVLRLAITNRGHREKNT